MRKGHRVYNIICSRSCRVL